MLGGRFGPFFGPAENPPRSASVFTEIFLEMNTAGRDGFTKSGKNSPESVRRRGSQLKFELLGIERAGSGPGRRFLPGIQEIFPSEMPKNYHDEEMSPRFPNSGEILDWQNKQVFFDQQV
jgi:hypothetical protein